MSTIDYNPSLIKVFKIINDRLLIFYGKHSVNYCGKNYRILLLANTDKLLKTWLLRKNLLEREFNHQEHRKNSEVQARIKLTMHPASSTLN